MQKRDFPALELVTKIVDINLKHLTPSLSDCEPLYGYSYLIEMIRTHGDIETAVKECVADHVLVDYLTEYGSEVINMLYTKYDAEKAKEYLIAESEARGEAKSIKKLYDKGKSIDEIADLLDLTSEAVVAAIELASEKKE